VITKEDFTWASKALDRFQKDLYGPQGEDASALEEESASEPGKDISDFNQERTQVP
jgi:hypothetical protein